MIRVLFISTFLSFSLLIGSECFSQIGGGGGITVQDGAGGPKLAGFGAVNLEKTIDYWVQQSNQKVGPQLELYLERIKTICHLNEDEATRLRIALKGVVTRRTASAARQIEQFAHRSGLVKPTPDHPSQVSDATVDDVEKLVFFSAAPRGDGVVALGAEFLKPIHEHPLWIATLETILTPEQLEAYRTHHVEQNRRNLNLAIDLWVASLNHDVLLSLEQTESITAHIRQLLASRVTAGYPTRVSEASELVDLTCGRQEEFLMEWLSPQQIALIKALKFREPGPKASWGPPIR